MDCPKVKTTICTPRTISRRWGAAGCGRSVTACAPNWASMPGTGAKKDRGATPRITRAIGRAATTRCARSCAAGAMPCPGAAIRSIRRRTTAIRGSTMATRPHSGNPIPGSMRPRPAPPNGPNGWWQCSPTPPPFRQRASSGLRPLPASIACNTGPVTIPTTNFSTGAIFRMGTLQMATAASRCCGWRIGRSARAWSASCWKHHRIPPRRVRTIRAMRWAMPWPNWAWARSMRTAVLSTRCATRAQAATRRRSPYRQPIRGTGRRTAMPMPNNPVLTVFFAAA